MNPSQNGENEDFNVGSIVSTQSHPFFKSTDKDALFISGDALSLPPLMVIAESVEEKNAESNEISWKCKCIWYSNKTGLFESIVLSSRLLKKIYDTAHPLEEKDIFFGATVILKTNFIELGKKKLSLKQSGEFADDKSKTITALLSFTSPVMQVIGVATNKENSLASKGKEYKKNISSQLIKCKFYNPVSEKFSEIIIPVEAVEKIVEIESSSLERINKLIADRCFLKIHSSGSYFKKTIFKPQRIIYKSGNYFVEGVDYLENITTEVLIEEFEEQFTVIETMFEELPTFEVDGSKVTITLIEKESLENLPQQNFWRIKYKDYNDKITVRTIYAPFYCESVETDEKKTKTINYLKAKCILKGRTERLFRIDRIQKLQVLDLLHTENEK